MFKSQYDIAMNTLIFGYNKHSEYSGIPVFKYFLETMIQIILQNIYVEAACFFGTLFPYSNSFFNLTLYLQAICMFTYLMSNDLKQLVFW